MLCPSPNSDQFSANIILLANESEEYSVSIISFALASYEFKKNGKELLPTFPAKLKMALQSMGLVSTLAFGFGSSGASQRSSKTRGNDKLIHINLVN